MFNYFIGTEHGFLKYNYTRQEIAACEENLLDMYNVIKLAGDRQLTLREAASNSSVAGPQGYQRCHCKTGCNNKRCACRGAENYVIVNVMGVQIVKTNKK